LKIALLQLNSTIGAFAANRQKLVAGYLAACAQGADFVLAPELFLCGYPPRDLLQRADFIDANLAALDETAQFVGAVPLCVGYVARHPDRPGRSLRNSAAILQHGRSVWHTHKSLLPTYDVFDERRYFEPGNSAKVWEFKGKRIGILVCEDIWQHAGALDFIDYAYDPVIELSHQPQLDLLINLSSSPYHYDKPPMRQKVCAAVAKTLGCPVLLCCQVGGNDQLVFDGYSMLVDSQGQLKQLGKGFVEDLLEIDLNAAAAAFSFTYDAVQDLYSALVLGVKDYFHKLGFKKGCLGLSGGIDSALVGCIAADALGKENVLGVAMPSRYSSASSLEDAQKLAQNLGIAFETISIEGPFESYLNLLTPHFHGKGPDITEENIQARVRGMILMALSNKLGYIVLSTANKSEFAMGYSTLYGDMCGGLAVISDVSKQQVYALAHWINRQREIIPLSSIEKPPSAELRPNQKDTDTLPDYSIVDAVLQDYVEEFLSPEEIYKKRHYSKELIDDLIHRIHCAEYKRRQGAPGIRVSRKAFRAGRRYPIVQKWK